MSLEAVDNGLNQFPASSRYPLWAPISSLFDRCGPAAIRRLVVAVVVDAIDCRAFGSRTHICEEVLEAVNPALADSNPAPAVIRVFLISRIQTSLLKTRPGVVLDRTFIVFRCTMAQIAHSLKYRRNIAMLSHSLPVHIAESTSISHSLAAFNRTCCPQGGLELGAADGNKQRIAVCLPTPIVHRTETASKPKPVASLNGTWLSGRILAHLEASLSGVIGQAVSAALPLYFTSVAAS